MLCGLLRPTRGTAHVGGVSVADDPDGVRRQIGLVPEDVGDHKNLTLVEELEYYGTLYGLDRRTIRQRSEPLLRRLDLAGWEDHRLKTFSRGMRRKFHLIRALLHEPRILLLDEPTAGLDPSIVEEVWDLLKALAEERHVTVILSSHHLEEVERLCSRVAIIRQHLLVEGTLAELSGGNHRYRVDLAAAADGLVEAAQRVDGVAQVAIDADTLRFSVQGEPREIVPHVVRSLVNAGAQVLAVAPESRDLRSLYKAIVGNGQDKAEGGQP